MAQEQSPSSGPDLTQGVTLAEFLDGKLAGHVGDQEVLLVHSGQNRGAYRLQPATIFII